MTSFRSRSPPRCAARSRRGRSPSRMKDRAGLVARRQGCGDRRARPRQCDRRFDVTSGAFRVGRLPGVELDQHPVAPVAAGVGRHQQSVTSSRTVSIPPKLRFMSQCFERYPLCALSCRPSTQKPCSPRGIEPRGSRHEPVFRSPAPTSPCLASSSRRLNKPIDFRTGRWMALGDRSFPLHSKSFNCSSSRRGGLDLKLFDLPACPCGFSPFFLVPLCLCRSFSLVLV